MATPEQIERALRAAHAAGNAEHARILAQAYREATAEAPAQPAAPSGPVVSPEALASVGLGGERPAARVAGISLDPAQMADDLLPPAIEYQDTDDGRIRLFPDSEPAFTAARERAEREQAYQEGQAARAQYDAALNPASWVDTVQHQTGGLYSATGDAVTGIGKVIQDTYNVPVGAPLTSTLSSLFGEGAPDLTMRNNPLEWYGDRTSRFGETLQGGTGAGYRELLEQNVWDGDITDRSTWTLGENPSLRGQMERGGEVIGSLLPVLLAAYATQGRASPVAGGMVGGGMAGTGAQDQAEDVIRGMAAEGTLYERSDRFRELVDAGADPRDAVEQLVAETRDAAFYPAAAVGGAGGAATSWIMNPANRLFGRLWLPARAAAMGTTSSTEEAVQEYAEGVATNAAINVAAGVDIPLNEGSFANVIGGLGAGGPTGAGGALFTQRVTGDQVRLERARDILLDQTAPIADRMAAAMQLDSAGFTVDEESITPADPNRDYRAESRAGRQAPVGAVAQEMADFQTPSEMIYGQAERRDQEAEAQAIVDDALAARGPRTMFDADFEAEAPQQAIPPRVEATVDGQDVGRLFHPTAEDVDANSERTTAGGELTISDALADILGAPAPQQMDGPAPLPDTQEIPDPDGDAEWKRPYSPTGRKDSKGRDIYEPNVDLSRDGLLEYLASIGGVNYDELRAAADADPSMLKDPAVMNPLGKVGLGALRRNGGVPLDRLFERMYDDGWFPQMQGMGGTSEIDVNDMYDMILGALNGEKVWHPTEGADQRIAREEVRRENDARFQLEQELGAIDETNADAAAAVADTRERAAAEIAEADGAEARSIYELARQAAAAGATQEQTAQQADEQPGAYASRLWQLTQGEARGPDQGTDERDSGPGVPGPRGEPAVDAGGPQAGTPATGLFGAPTAREQVDGEARARADRRDGRTGGVTPSFSGTPLGALGAGPAPAQADVEGATEQKKATGRTAPSVPTTGSEPSREEIGNGDLSAAAQLAQSILSGDVPPNHADGLPPGEVAEFIAAMEAAGWESDTGNLKNGEWVGEGGSFFLRSQGENSTIIQWDLDGQRDTPEYRSRHRGSLGWDTVPLGDGDRNGPGYVAQALDHLFGGYIEGTITTVAFDADGNISALADEDADNKAYVLVDTTDVPKGVGGRKKLDAMDAGVFWGLPLAYDAGSPEFAEAAIRAAVEYARANGIAVNPAPIPEIKAPTKSGRRSKKAADISYDPNDFVPADEDIAEQRDDDAQLHSDAEITEDADAERDELRRKRKAKTKKKSGPLSVTRDEAPLAYELDIFLDNGYTELDVADMTPQGKATVAARIVKQTFGFQSVTVANNLNTLTAINQLTFAYSNLQSMAAVMAWPAEAIGKLSPNLILERGNARGALASYSPGERTIRMSEQHDTFAHEFGHALDWWVWQTMKQVDPATGEPRGRAATGKLKLGGELTNRPVMDAFVALNGAMFSGQGDAALKIASIEKHILVQRNKIADLQDRADVATDPARKAAIEQAIEKRKAHITRLAKQITDIKAAPKPNYKVDSDYYLNARLLDKATGTDGGGSDGGYWQRPTEMFARAYEAWVADRVERAGGHTAFLGREDAGYLQSSVDFIAKAYPQQIDRDRIFTALDALMDAVRDDVIHGLDGKPMAKVRPGDPIPPAAWTGWAPRKSGSLNVRKIITESLDEAKQARQKNAAEDRKLADARRKVRDTRNPQASAAVDLALRAHDAQRDFFAGWTASIAGFLRTMEARYPGSATFAQVSRMFTHNVGSGQLRGQTYEEFRSAELAKRAAKLGMIAERHGLNSSRKWPADKLRLLRDAMVDHREGSARPSYPPEVLAAVADLRTFHDELWQDARNAGFEIGYTKNGYLQRMVDEAAVSADQAGFLKAAAEVYAEVFESEVGKLDEGNLGAIAEAARDALPRTDPEARQLIGLLNAAARAEAAGETAAAEAAIEEAMQLLEDGLYERIQEAWSSEAASDWMGRILGTTASGDMSVQSARGRFMKSRALPQSSDIIMGNFMVTDPASLSATYMVSLVNRMAFEKFVPKVPGQPDASPARRIDEIRANLVREGVLPADVEETMASVTLMVGLYKTNMTKRGLRFQSWLSATYAPVVLGRALMSQLIEPATVGLVTHNPRDTAAMFLSQATDLAAVFAEQTKFLRAIPGVRQLLDRANARSEWMHEMSAFIGAVSDSHFDFIMNNRENTLFANKRAGQKLASFYRWSGIHPHAMSIRRASVERSIHYLKRIAAKAQKGDAAAKRDLNDLGIDASNAALVKYLADEMSTRPTTMELEASTHAAEISAAVNRFVDRVSQNPKIVDKPRAASTPERSFMYVVMSFASAFTQNIIMAEGRKFAARWKHDGAGAAAGYAAWGGLNLSIFMGLHALQYLFRVWVQTLGQGLDDELERWEENPWEAFFTVLTRSGMAGFAGDPLLNAFSGFKYERSLSEFGVGAYFGAAIGWLSSIGRAATRNSEDTNTSEHKIAREAWQGLVAPAIAHLILSRAPWATPALMLTSSPAAKEAAADALVGPRDSKKEKSGTPADTSRQSRQNGRGSSRGSSRGSGRGQNGRG